MLQILRRFFGLPTGGWPSRTPPTVTSSAPEFYCADCKDPVPAAAKACPACGAPTGG